jgi:type II secretion system protein N
MTMSKAKQRLLYTIYFICTTVFFLYLLFPSEAAKQFLMVHLNQINRDVQISFETVDPAFPPGVELDSVTVFHRNERVFVAEAVDLSIGILPLFILRPTVKFKCDAYDGQVAGKVGVSAFDVRKVSADIRLKNLNIGGIEAFHMALPQYDFFGIVSGSVTGNTRGKNGLSLKSGLRLADGRIEFITPLYGLDNLSFTEMETEFEIDGMLLKIDRLTAEGSDLTGSIAGTVNIKYPVRRSKLNLKGEVTPGPDIIKKLGELEPMISVFLRNRSGKKGLPINLNGTLDNPGFFNLPARR